MTKTAVCLVQWPFELIRHDKQDKVPVSKSLATRATSLGAGRKYGGELESRQLQLGLRDSTFAKKLHNLPDALFYANLRGVQR